MAYKKKIGSWQDLWLGGGNWKPRRKTRRTRGAIPGGMREPNFWASTKPMSTQALGRTAAPPLVQNMIDAQSQFNPRPAPISHTPAPISPTPPPINPTPAMPPGVMGGMEQAHETNPPLNLDPAYTPFEVGEVKEKGLLDRAGDFISRKWEGRDRTPMDSPVNRGLIQFGLSAMNPDTYYNKEGFGIGALGAFSKAGQAGLAEHDKITKMLAKREDRRFDRDIRDRLYDLEVDKGDRAQEELGFREQEIDLLGDRFDLDQKNIKGLIKTRAGQLKLQERIFDHNKWKDSEANEQMKMSGTDMSFTKAQWAKIIPTIVSSQTELDAMTMYMVSQMEKKEQAVFMKQMESNDPMTRLNALFKKLIKVDEGQTSGTGSDDKLKRILDSRKPNG